MSNSGMALAVVHEAMDYRLFGERNWLVDRESGEVINRLLHKHGFMLQLADGSSRNTQFGNEAGIDLLMCFLGLWDEWEIPDVLHDRGYISLEECECLYEQLERSEPEQVLRPVVQKVWRLFCNPSGLLS